MYTRLILLIILLISSNFSSAQEYITNVEATKNNVIYIFNKSMIPQSRNTVSSNPWYTDNTNGRYADADTLVFFKVEPFKKDFCNIVNWTFYNHNKFVISYDSCNVRQQKKKNDYINLKVKEIKNNIVIELYNRKRMTDKFSVISLKEIQSFYPYEEKKYTLILKRIK